MSGVSIGTASRPASGETVCGDQVRVVRDGAATTIAIADGLGHGPRAAQAATAFCAVVERHPAEPLELLFARASRELEQTRGAAAVVLRVDAVEGTLLFSGVGNVETRAISKAPIRPISTPGIVGRRLLRARELRYPLAAGDLLVVFTDGVSSRLDVATVAELSSDPQAMADRILEIHGKGHDDATCVVIRYE
jgi:serine/threonine protein phosphatase PrpC